MVERHASVDVPRFLRYLRRRFAGEARAKGLALIVEAAEGTPASLQVGLVPLARVLCNLLGNAIKFTEAGAVRLSAEPANGGILFRLADDGPGLNMDALDKAFRFGYRPHGSTKPGQGLGLHIVQALTERLGGRVVIANRAAGGMEAQLIFPASLCDASRPAAPRTEEPGVAGADLAGLHVLLAEDNLTNQMVATQMLRALDAEVTVCSDGVEALQRFEEEAFDLVVVDIEMPRLSGLDVIRAIRARSDARAGVPIVALTAYAMREHRDRIAEAGANGLISKPITSIEAFGRALAMHLAPDARAAKAAAPAADGGQDEGVVDLAVFDALCQAIGQDTMAELLEKVIADLLSARAELVGAPERGPIRSASHILISVAGALGATRLQACARRLNAAAHTEAMEGLADELARCLEEIDAAVDFARERRGAD